MNRARGILVGAGVFGLVALLLAAQVVWAQWQQAKDDQALLARMSRIAPQQLSDAHPCPWQGPAGSPRPVVLLILGQSNAGNHGAEQEPPPAAGQPVVTVIDGQACRRATEPLPGGTGQHRAMWTHLEPELARAGVAREVAISLLAVDGTTVDDWTRASSPLRERLDAHLLALQGAPINFVLWQQGEADARAGTTTASYESAFGKLLQHLRARGVTAPVVVARSTRCRSGAGAEPIRRAIANVAQTQAGVLSGPDTDALSGAMREQDCNFSRAGLQAAAALWAQSLAPWIR